MRSTTSERLSAGIARRTERLLDAAPLRLLARGVVLGRDARAEHRARGRARRRARAPSRATEVPPDAAAPELLRALEAALGGGGYETAAALAAALRPRIEELEGEARRRAVLALLGVLLANGARDDAAALGGQHRAILRRSASGAGHLALLGLHEGEDPFVPDGALDSFGVARRLEEGAWDGARLLRALARRPHVWLREPQTHLLGYQAFLREDEARAARFLSRCLRAHAAGGCHLAPGEGPPLFRLRFEPGAPVRGPLVSVVVAAYAAEASVVAAVDSILAQSYRDLEVLVADDASPDGTLSLLRDRYAGEPRVRLFRSEANQGPYNLRNALLERARGELLSFHDADDVALPTRIARQVAALSRPDARACVGRLIRMRADGRVLFFPDQSAIRMSMVTLMMRREAYRAVGPYRRARFGADHELIEALRRRYGPAGVTTIRAPLMLGAWAEGSLSRGPTSSLTEDGYRSPARQRYAELVFQKGRARPPSDREIDRALEEDGNLAAPAPVHEVGD